MKVRFNIEYFTGWGQNLFLHCGEHRFPMKYDGEGTWSATVSANDSSQFKEYHYEVEYCGMFERREWGHHSIADIRTLPEENGTAIVRDYWFTIQRSAGVAVPVFSLRSRNSFGTGEFNDIIPLVDWAAATGQKVIQILPVNDTTMTGTWVDSYPYSANSIYALHPHFINLADAGVPEDEDYRKLQEELNALPAVDYERVGKEKDRLLRKAFKDRWPGVSRRKDFKEFMAGSSGWLLPYAAFRILTARYGTADFSKWEEYAQYSAEKTEALLKKEKQECNYHCFVQYHLHLQLKKARDYAHAHGVYLKGDLPIGISPDSTDAWTSPELFHLDSQAGAPPDAFAAKGQNWGLPTYNWEKMSEDGYAWWKERMKNMAGYFDLFRIDHILGFFRIWEIPRGASSGLLGHFSPALPYNAGYLRSCGFDLPDKADPVPASEDVLFIPDPHAEGYWHPRIAAQDTDAYRKLDGWHKKAFDSLYYDFFYHRHNTFWKESALRKLPELLSATEMLACGEDLGMIPDCVPEVMQHLHILSLEIQRMPKLQGEEFADVSRYPSQSVCSTSTHDMNPLRAWWTEDREKTERFFHEVLHGEGPAPDECEPDICTSIVRMHLDSPSLLAIFPLQDWLSTDGEMRQADAASERINDPAENPHYWRYRMHISLEELIAAEKFNHSIRTMIQDSGRL